MAPKTKLRQAQEAQNGLAIKEQMSLTEMLDERQQIPDLSWDELLQKLDPQELDNVSELGGGFHLVKKDDKSKFEGVPFVILYFRINDKWRYGAGVSMMIQTAVPVVFDGERYERFIINDGSTGIAQQLFDYKVATGKQGPILCKRGLRSSTYEVMEDDPTREGERRVVIDPATQKPVVGTTFYLDTSL